MVNNVNGTRNSLIVFSCKEHKMDDQKVNSSESNDNDYVFKNPDDLDLDTMRRVKEALEDLGLGMSLIIPN